MPTFILDDDDDDTSLLLSFMRLISDNAYEAPSKIVIGIVPCLSVMILSGKMVFERVVAHDDDDVDDDDNDFFFLCF